MDYTNLYFYREKYYFSDQTIISQTISKLWIIAATGVL